MIILSGVLVVLAIALLVTGIVTGNTGHEIAGLDGLKLIYVSIGVSIVSALFLAIGVFLRRKELFGSAASQTSKKASTTAVKAGKAARPAKTKARVGAAEETPIVPVASPTATDVPAETTVYVVRGRKRYHLDTCRQLAGRDKEELTFVEAREEGFTACTACLPDTALAARAALADTETAEQRPAATEPVERAQITRTDLPVTSPSEPVTEHLEPAAPEPAAADTAVHPVSHDDYTTHDTYPSHDAYADATDDAEVADLAEPAETAEPATDEPTRRSRSLFEPLDDEHPVTSNTEDEPATAEEPEDTATEADHEPSADETELESHEPSHDEPEPAIDDERETDEDLADKNAQTHEPSDHESPDDEPAAHGLSDHEDLDHGLTDHEDPDHGLSDREPADLDDADHGTAAALSDHEDPDHVPADHKPAHEDTDVDGTDDEDPEHESLKDETPDTLEPGTAAATDDEADHTDDADEDSDDDTEQSSLSIVRILSGTKRYHRTDCALIEDIAEDADDLETVTPAEAKERGCTPCLVCQPDKDSADDF